MAIRNVREETVFCEIATIGSTFIRETLDDSKKDIQNEQSRSGKKVVVSSSYRF